MRKVTWIAVALLAVGALAVAAEEQIAEGKVKAVSGNTVTVAGENGEVWEFEAVSGTRVAVEGARHIKRNLAGVGMKTTIGYLVHEDQLVTVQYWEEDGTRFIKRLQVR